MAGGRGPEVSGAGRPAAAAGELGAGSLVGLSSLPAALMTVGALREKESRALNLLVRNSARLHMQFGVLLAVGLLYGAL